MTSFTLFNLAVRKTKVFLNVPAKVSFKFIANPFSSWRDMVLYSSCLHSYQEQIRKQVRWSTRVYGCPQIHKHLSSSECHHCHSLQLDIFSHEWKINPILLLLQPIFKIMKQRQIYMHIYKCLVRNNTLKFHPEWVPKRKLNNWIGLLFHTFNLVNDI